MPTRRSFVVPGDLAEVVEEVVFHGDHGDLVRAIVADRAVSPLSHVTPNRAVDAWSESEDREAGRWIGHDGLYMIRPLSRPGEAL